MAGALIAIALLCAAGLGSSSQDMGAAVNGDGELLEALQTAPAQELDELLRRAHRRLVAHAERGDLAAALPLAEALFARAPAPWSADSLSLTLSRLGQHERARAVLEPLIAALPAGAEFDALRQRRALAALGAGRRDLALADLGAGLASGDADAAVVLGFLALRGGEGPLARALFRSVLLRLPASDPRQAWARRGWGLTMLP